MRVRNGALVASILMLAACTETNSDRQSAKGSGYFADAIPPAPKIAGDAIPANILDGKGVADRVLFAYDSIALTPEARATIVQWAEVLRQYPTAIVTIEGHADERGTREYNLALGERRAITARSYLLSLGVAPQRVASLSYGKERPAIPGSDESAWSQNRRAALTQN